MPRVGVDHSGRPGRRDLPVMGTGDANGEREGGETVHRASGENDGEQSQQSRPKSCNSRNLNDVNLPRAVLPRRRMSTPMSVNGPE